MASSAVGEPTTRISLSLRGEQSDQSSWTPSISDDGRLIAFEGPADLEPGFDCGTRVIYVHDRSTGRTSRITPTFDCSDHNNYREVAFVSPEVTPDGRYIAFFGITIHVVGGLVVDRSRNIYVYDMSTGLMTKESPGLLAPATTTIDAAEGSQPSISDDGRFVAYAAYNPGEGTGGVNFYTDIFVRDRLLRVTKKVSVSSTGEEANASSHYPRISGDGRFVVFQTGASNLVAEHNELSQGQVYVHDLTTSTTEAVNRSTSGSIGNNSSSSPQISYDGRYVAFASDASNLVEGDANQTLDVFLRDRQLGVTSRVSVDSAGGESNGFSYPTALSATGRFVAFSSGASNLVPADTNATGDAFLHDRVEGSTTRVSVNSCGGEAHPPYAQDATSVTGDGRYIGFQSAAPDLVPGDTNGQQDVFLHDRSLPFKRCDPPVGLPRGRVMGGPGSQHAYNPASYRGDPVNTAIGNYWSQVTDAALPATGVDFDTTRSYNSQDPTEGPLGRGWRQGYEARLDIQPNGDVIFVSEGGQESIYASNGDGSYAAAPGVLSDLVATADGYKLSTKTRSTYGFDSQGRLASIQDRNGQGIALGYAVGGDDLVDSVTDSSGRTVQFSNSNGRLDQLLLPDGRQVTYHYASGNLVKVTDVRGNNTVYEYDANNRLAKVFDQNGNRVVSTVYGSDGRVIEQRDANNNLTKFSWDAATQTSVMQDAHGYKWTDVYSNNVLVRSIDPLGHTTSYEYDEDLNLTAVVNPRGFRTTMRYDEDHNLIALVPPSRLGYEERFTYDGAGNLLTHTDRTGDTTNYGYDSAGNLTALEYPDGSRSNFVYDAAGQGLLQALVDQRGHRTQFGYDDQGNLTSVTSPGGGVTTFGYDSSGRVTSFVDPRGNEVGADPSRYRWVFGYDAANHKILERDPLANETTWSFDPSGNVTSWVNAKARKTSYAYDPANRLVSVTAPDGSATGYTYDALGHLRTRKDALGRVSHYSYDAAGRLRDARDPLGRLWSYKYDAADNLKVLTDPRGVTTNYHYDRLDRLSNISYRAGSSSTVADTPSVDLEYDNDDRVVEMRDGFGSETYAYDTVGRLVSVARGNRSFGYVYDAEGHIIRRDHPDGTQLHYTYDSDDHLSSVRKGDDETTYAFDAAGNQVGRTLPVSNGHVESRFYDEAGRLNRIREVNDQDVLRDVSYVLDGVGNPITETDADDEISYTYDALERLNEVCFTAPCSTPAGDWIRYSYDAVGNRLKEQRPGRATTYSYDAADQLKLSDDGAEVTAYEHDAAGNLVRSGGASYGYDVANRMVAAQDLDTITSYAYDGMGKRLVVRPENATGAATGQRFWWDVTFDVPQMVLEEQELVEGATRSYVHGRGLIFSTSQTSTAYFHQDRIGSVTDVTDSAGLPQWSYSYEPFGSPRTTTKVNPLAPDNAMRFTGEYLDPTGLYHLRARQYDSGLGRFTAPDPLAPDQADPAVSTYSYAENRPSLFVDPTGMRMEYGGTGGGLPVDPAVIKGMQVAVSASVAAFLAGPHVQELGEVTCRGVMSAIDWFGGPTLVSHHPIPEGWSPTDPPGEGWTWKGTGKPGSGQGNWVNPETGEKIHPDLDHPPPIGPHHDYIDREGRSWRVFPDGTKKPK